MLSPARRARRRPRLALRTASMPASIPLAILGFSNFERNAFAARLKIESGRAPSYGVVLDIDQAALVIADADQGGVTELLREIGRVGDSVFIGASAPAEAAAWMMRPLDPATVMRECDRLLRERDRPSSKPMPLGLPGGTHGARAAAQKSSLPARRAGDAAPPCASGEPARLGVFEARPRPAQRPPPPGLAVRRALLVDDSEIALHFLRHRLDPYDIAADLAYDSGEALALLAAQPYGIVFVDVDLGEGSELDGLGLCKRIKARQAPLAGRMPLVVLVSAFHDAVHQVRGTLAGADAYLAKPLERDAFERLCTRLGLPGAEPAPPPSG